KMSFGVCRTPMDTACRRLTPPKNALKSKAGVIVESKLSRKPLSVKHFYRFLKQIWPLWGEER
ncbi:MAG TPA: hypothetical protein VN048_09190, partial [Verrucomicrobiae bacterium]|nr:hypothetical protein [Verrucomicrobiae bacterium]